MINQPRVSVIVPAYNAQKSIGECLAALENQSFPRDRYEVIVVDDGSVDSTSEIIKKFRVRYHYQENQGPARARNLGAGSARGELIFFTDADCIADPDWIRQMAASLKKPDIVGVKGAYKTNQARLWARFAQIEFQERYELLKTKKTIDMVDTYSAGYRKDIFEKAGGFDTSFPVPNNEDTDLSYRLSSMGYKMIFNPNAVVYHTNHPDSLLGYGRLKFWRGYWRMVVYEKFASKMIKDSYTPQSLKLQIFFVYLFLASVLGWPLLGSISPFISACCLLMFLSTAVSFMLYAAKFDLAVALLSPYFIFVRASAVGGGVILRIARKLSRRHA